MTYSEQVFINDVILRGKKIKKQVTYFVPPYCKPNVKLLKVKRYVKVITANNNCLVSSEHQGPVFVPLLGHPCIYVSYGSCYMHCPVCSDDSQCVIYPFMIACTYGRT